MLTIEKAGRRFQVNLAGNRLDSFERRREAQHMLNEMAPYEDKMLRLWEVQRAGKVNAEWRSLTVEINAAYLQAQRTMP